MSEINISADFQKFCNSLRMSDNTVSNVRNRYHMITKRINQVFWNSDSIVSHSWYVGSYGRGTSIYTSDIDIVVEIPWTEYERYDNYLYNGQSSLLATLRNCLRIGLPKYMRMQFKRIKEVTRQRSKLYKRKRNNSFMKRSWLIFYHSICANDFSCLRSL